MNIQAQEWLLNRLLHFGADIYDGKFPSLRDRLAHGIVAHRLQSAIAGRHEGRAVTYRQAWERIYERELPREVRQ
jgi:hypothetical protein